MTGPKEITVKAEGLTVDLLCARHYRKRAREETTELVLNANPGLAAIAAKSKDLTLPLGTKVLLPALPEREAVAVITLWD